MLIDFLRHFFSHQDEDKTHVPRSQRHGNVVQCYLSGNITHGVSQIIQSGELRAVTDKSDIKVVAHCPILDFCKNDYARLLPFARGILYLSSLVPADIIAYNSRVAGMPSVNTIKAALTKFVDQKDFAFRLLFAGGDRLSYNNTHMLQRYLQNHHPDAFRSFEIFRPVLQIWHTLWTNLCRIFKTYWAAPLNDNFASLGHSAKKIGRTPPANFKKVDYYLNAQLLNLDKFTPIVMMPGN
ncbi:hypothetical protein B0H19DRAFT_1064633 [Mycena capillaripes]|nr:hypothetical protein B0H19DRAFT_1064633 [Mycena capillaripes]